MVKMEDVSDGSFQMNRTFPTEIEPLQLKCFTSENPDPNPMPNHMPNPMSNPNPKKYES